MINWVSRKTTKLTVIMLTLLLPAYIHASDKLLFQELLRIAEQGSAEAQYNVGMMLNNGLGTSKDPRKAFDWFRKAADSGDPLGAYKVGCYYDGQHEDVVPVDPDKALHYKLIAANAGYSLAQHDIGGTYYRQSKFSDSLHWLKLASDQGFPMSLYNLSMIYHEGKHVPKDPSLTYAFFKLAKLRSEGRISPKAQKALDKLRSDMSRAEIEKAEEEVSEWQAKPTQLTIRAASGIKEARKLVEDDAR